MRQLPEPLLAHLAEGATTLCNCWRLRRADGVVMGFTDHDRAVQFDTCVFAAGAGLEATAGDTPLGLAVGGAEISGVLNSSVITEADLSGGLYDGARVEIWRVNWTDPSQRLLMDVAEIGEVRRSREAFTAELRSLAHMLDQERGRHYQALCNADLGDERCGVDVNFPAHFALASVSGGDGRVEIATGASGFESGYFDNGRLTILDGDNAGVSRTIEAYQLHGAGAIIRLWSRFPAPVSIGAQVKLTVGCDKSLATCRSRFANQTRFRGFAHMPGNDALMSHVSGGNTRMDGASLFT